MTTSPRYHEPTPITHAEAQAAFADGRPQPVTDALVRLAFHDPDWRWVQEQCLGFLEHSDAAIRGLAATCLGHLARIHGELDRDRVVAQLTTAAETHADPETQGIIEDALGDIEQFLGDG